MAIPFHKVDAQENKGMFMNFIKGGKFIKKNFDSKGTLTSYQEIQVGKIKTENDLFVMPIRVYMFNAKGVLKDSIATKYNCSPTESEVLMTIIPIVGLVSTKTIGIKLNSKQTLYPSNWVVNKSIPDYMFSMNLEGGLIGFLGTTTKLFGYERKVVEYNSNENTYKIISRIRISAYVFGIKIDTINYQLEENINPQLGILRQEFKKSTGDYFIVLRENE